MKFIGFLIFTIVASAAFFVPLVLGLTLPLAAKPDNDDEGEEEA